MNNEIQLHDISPRYIEQPESEKKENMVGALTFFHGICHSNNRIYGIPFCSDYILEIMPTEPLKLSLYQLPSVN